MAFFFTVLACATGARLSLFTYAVPFKASRARYFSLLDALARDYRYLGCGIQYAGVFG
jgi:hypothetical protein